MQKKINLNPFTIFFTIILGVLLVYSFNWSKLNEPLTPQLILFFLIILVTLPIFSKLYTLYFPEGTFIKRKFRVNLIPCTLVAIFSMIAEFAYEKVIPIVEILVFKNGYNYADFEGIPVFHVFAVTYISFLGLYYWQLFLEEKKWYLLFFSLFFVFFPMMLFNRGGFIMNICSMFFILLMTKKSITLKLKHIIVFIGTILLGLYLFGVFGNIRSDKQSTYKGVTDSSFILRVGEATEEFKQSIIPTPYFWGYLYISTPIANLQYMTEKIEPSYDTTLFVTQTILPDFIGKRVEEKVGKTVQADKRRSPVFNVSTMFISSYKTLGFLGMLLTYVYFVFFIFLYATMMKKMYTTKAIGIAIISTMTVFSLFDNMMVFSGLSFQLVFPVIFWIYKKL